MIKRYLSHMHAQPPHHRRQHALKVASGVTAVVFVGWILTLGYRVSDDSKPTVAGDAPSAETQLANVISGVDTPQNTNTLEVATTSSYTGF